MGKRKYCTQETFDVSDVILPPVCLGSIFFGAIFPNSTNRVNQLNWLNLVGYNARKPRFWPEFSLIFATHLGRMHLSLPQGAGSRCAWNLEITSFQDVPYWNQGFHSFHWWDIKFSLHATGDLSQCYNIMFFFWRPPPSLRIFVATNPTKFLIWHQPLFYFTEIGLL